MMTVRLRESTVALLMTLREGDGETLDAVIARLACAATALRPPAVAAPPVAVAPVPSPRSPPSDVGKYALVMLGETIHAATLGELFADVVDTLVRIDPGSIERLATMRARKRFYVARDKAVIHPGRPDLAVRRTASGWWVSDNVGTADIERALRAACEASGLAYGRDVRFEGRSGRK